MVFSELKSSLGILKYRVPAMHFMMALAYRPYIAFISLLNQDISHWGHHLTWHSIVHFALCEQSCLWLHGKIYLWRVFCMVFRLEFPSAWISMEWEQSVWTLAMWAECFAELCLPKPQTRVLAYGFLVKCPYVALSPGISAAGDNWAFTLYETSKEIETLWMIHCRGFALCSLKMLKF